MTRAHARRLLIAAIEQRQKNDSARNDSAQELEKWHAEAQALLVKLRQGDPTGGEGLRSETARRFGPKSAALLSSSEQSIDAAVLFVVGKK
jgi:hypothetical protein